MDKLIIEILENPLVEIPIRSFNGKYEPLDLISRLEPMVKLGFIKIDWRAKVINKTGMNYLDLVQNKKELSKEIGNVPENMKQEKIKVNKPFN